MRIEFLRPFCCGWEGRQPGRELGCSLTRDLASKGSTSSPRRRSRSLDMLRLPATIEARLYDTPRGRRLDYSTN